jgi:anti-sigma-K factor RskA
MADPEIHVDVAGYALGTLDAAESAAFERHLYVCQSCRAEVLELRPVVSLLRRVAPPERAPAFLKARTLGAIERDTASLPSEAVMAARPDVQAGERRRRRWFPRIAYGGAAVAAVIAAGIIGVRVGEERQPGAVEVDARLTSPRGSSTVASIRVTETGIGRIIALESDTLPELDNDREFYELWFVGPGDSPRSPNRVSAGTFHPDTAGHTAVRLAAAAVPSDYPVVSVTREPRDGDPRPTGSEVLRSPAG